MSSSIKGDIVGGFVRGKLHESSLCDTFGIARLHKDQILVVSKQALVDPTYERIDSSHEINLCPPSARTCNLNKVSLSCDDSCHTLVDPCENQGESMLACEFPSTSEGVNNDQLTHECSPLLENIYGMLNESQVSDDVDRVDHENKDNSMSI